MNTIKSAAGPASDDSPHTEHWDKAEMLDRLGGDEDLLRELVSTLVEESPRLLDTLREAIASSDSDAVMRGAHSIKGSVSCFGGGLVEKSAQRLETMGKTKGLSEAAATFAGLERDMARLLLELRQLQAGQAGPAGLLAGT